MKIKNIGIILIVLSLVLCGCSHKNIDDKLSSSIPVRLANDYNSDWGLEAVNYSSDNSVDDIKIAVLDSGSNEQFSQIIASYNVMDNTDAFVDEINHGTIILKKLTQLLPSAEIVLIKVFNNNNFIDPLAIKKGIEIAIENDVDIINLSLGYKDYSAEVEEVLESALKKGITIVAAAGNQGEPSLLYPAKHEGVISVFSRDINNKDSLLNNYSSEKKSFSAPGDHILVDGYGFVTGSSIACVFVTATLANIKSTSDASVNSVDILIQNAIYPTEHSYGLIQYKK